MMASDLLEEFYQNTYLPQMKEVNSALSAQKSQIVKLQEDIRILKLRQTRTENSM